MTIINIIFAEKMLLKYEMEIVRRENLSSKYASRNFNIVKIVIS